MKPPGEMKTFDTGAKREEKTGKGRFDLISPIMLRRLAILMEEGGLVHGDRSWELGMPLSGLLSSAIRHTQQTLDGLEDEDHPIQAIWNLMAYIHTLHRIRTGSLPTELDDLPREMNLGKKNLESDLTSDKKPATIQRDIPKLIHHCPGCSYHLGRSYLPGCFCSEVCPRCGAKL